MEVFIPFTEKPPQPTVPSVDALLTVMASFVCSSFPFLSSSPFFVKCHIKRSCGVVRCHLAKMKKLCNALNMKLDLL